ncbi:hypothetical protein GDO86_013632 [Hymenochirus boettgeri]|uniref:procollagen-proline 3-dioxygenase n=1 Tax=Hymenochirus boettgeri TaxID=247094 RepID=A0A8T2IVQ4_9PIPI|nr:hypothetical protein GDO86_013632 [Hymenochirus boettgeri]
MAAPLVVLCLLLVTPRPSVSLLPPADLLLWDGISLFSRGDWSGARDRLLGALRSHREVRGQKLRCGKQCGIQGGKWLEEVVLERADCLVSCERIGLGEPTRYRLTRDTERNFHRATPYNYLQVAHYRLEELNEAAAAAFTFYLRNPHHQQIQDDVIRFRSMKGVREKSFRDLEEPNHVTLFTQAVSLLSEGKIKSAVGRLEESLTLFLSAQEDCRSLCEGTQEQENEVHRDISEVIAEYYIQVLQCKQRCVLEDSYKGQKHPREDTMISLLTLLEEGYAKLENWESANQIARSLLLFHPQNKTIQERIYHYKKKSYGQNSIKPRKSVAGYVHRTLEEKKLLYYAMENLGISFQDPDFWTPDEIVPESLRETVTVALTPNQMNGTMRVTMDGVISKEECKALLSLTKEAAGSGDVLRWRRSPHTPYERIQGLGVLRALQMASSGALDSSQAQLYYHTSERARVLTQFYFETKKLHFSYTQLVCQSAIEGEQEGRTDLSHPVQADNCELDTEEKECYREPPAYVHRDYSGLLYLNEDFQGGDLFFTAMDGTTVTAELHPSCGRLVLFSSGGENAHGVRAVTGGKRCAIEMWFTESAEHADQERSRAKALVGDGDLSQESSESENTKNIRETGRDGRSASDSEKPTGRSHRRSSGRSFKDEL